MTELWPWLVLFGLGAFHGINPAMGWLFAVALGLQEGKGRAVGSALVPIALGHALSIGAVLAVVGLVRARLPQEPLKLCAAAVLLLFAGYRLLRTRHPRWVGMRVGFRDLTLWSFVMASAHGAGLMLIPIVIGGPEVEALEYASISRAALELDPVCSPAFAPMNGPVAMLAAAGVHTVGHLVAAALVAWIVFAKVGVRILRQAWFNLDLVWVAGLFLCGVLLLSGRY